MRNPFTPYSVPRELFGRQREIALAGEHLDHVARDGQPAPNLLVFTGVRGVGKTSLLSHIAEDAASQGFVTVWVSGYRNKPITAELASAIDQALAAAQIKGSSWTKQTLSLEVSLPGLKGSASRESEQRGNTLTSVAAVERLLSEAALACAERGGNTGVGLAVFLDELHASPVDDLGVLLNALQNITTAGRAPLAMIAAGIPSISGNLTRAATFGERTRFVMVPLLDLRSAADALVWLADVGGAALDPDAARLLASEATGFPYLLQLYGDHAWRIWAARGGTGVISMDDAQAGVRAAQADAHATYQARWDAATPGEQKVILAMAEVMRASGEQVARRTDVAEQLGVSSGALSALRERLIGKAVIEEAGRGLLRFAMPGFAEFVQSLDG